MIDGFNQDNAIYPWIHKRQGEKLDYTWDISKDLALLGGDTIATYVITQHAGLTRTVQMNTATTVTAWFAGGVVGEDMWATCTFTTVGGREIVRTIYLRIIPR